MKFHGIIARYIARRYLYNFFASLAVLTLLTFVISISDEIRSFIDLKVDFILIAKYLGYKLPYMVLYSAPFASLVSTLLTLSGLNKTNEIMAMRTSGISTTGIIAPILVLALLISCSVIILNETFVTRLHAKSTLIRVRDIWKSTPSDAEIRNNIIFKSKDGWVAYIKYFNGERNFMTGIMLIYPDGENNIKRRIDAEKAVWDGSRWHFTNGIVRDFPENNREKAFKFKDYYPLITENPVKISSRKKIIDQLTLRELNEEIKFLEIKGEKSGEEKLYLHLKISYAFSIFMLAFLAVPFGLRTGKYSGVIISFAISFAVGFIYWQILSIGKVLGMHNVLPPYIAAWGGNLIFLIAGSLMFFSIKK